METHVHGSVKWRLMRAMRDDLSVMSEVKQNSSERSTRNFH